MTTDSLYLLDNNILWEVIVDEVLFNFLKFTVEYSLEEDMILAQ